eukprot:TRINITY_DN2052_c0_g1_i2.p1 TRINITY_DN2052_c0_g1~~TRINITY_DN2052_c0_g1_i2.p1  ORF type:complete len:1233 (-),score=291.67 TRINITY_DN2052_c0_g1_i2:287-3985(-)
MLRSLVGSEMCIRDRHQEGAYQDDDYAGVPDAYYGEYHDGYDQSLDGAQFLQTPGGTEYVQPPSGWAERYASCCSHDGAEPGNDPVSVVGFVGAEEFVWAGTADGRCTKLTLKDMQRYVSRPLSYESTGNAPRDVIAIADAGRGHIMIVCAGGIQMLTQGGQHVRSVYHEALNLMICATPISNPNSAHGVSHLAVCTGSRMIHNFDVRKGLPTVSIPTESSVCCICMEGRTLLTGNETGQLELRDSRTLTIQASVQAHSGGVSSIDCKDGLVATCGCSLRHGQYTSDNMVNIYDVRRSLAAVKQVPFMAGPQMLKFHPIYTGTLVVASASGQFALIEVLGDYSCSPWFQVATMGFAITSLSISLSGEIMCFGDSGGVVHLWADREEYAAHSSSQPLVLVPREPPLPSFQLDQESSFTAAGHVAYSNAGELASSWVPTSRKARKAYSHAPFRLRPEWRASMQNRGAVWHMSNSLELKPNTQSVSSLLRTPKKADTPTHFKKGRFPHSKHVAPEDEGYTSANLPDKIYRRVEVKLPKMTPGSKGFLGEFDFAQYNSTSLGGLENGIPNDYVNPWIQVLYFIAPVRLSIILHDCDKQHSLTSELGFLFRMLDMSNGLICHCRNFLRALRHNPTAEQLCLLETVSGQKVSTNVPYPQRVERFSDFFLSQLQKESADNNDKQDKNADSWLNEQFGCQLVAHMRCEGCLCVKDQGSCTTSFDMKYDGSSFCQIISSTLCKARSFRMQCGSCKRSNLFKCHSSITRLPNALIFKCDLSGAEPSDPRLALWRSDPTWLKPKLHIRLDHEGRAIVDETEFEDGTGYVLTGIITRVTDVRKKKSAKKDHFVAVVRVPGMYLEGREKSHGGAAAESHQGGGAEWFVLNDFRVSPTTQEEAVSFVSEWKTPCVLIYSVAEVANASVHTPAPALKNTLSISKSISNGSPLPPRFITLQPDEVLEAGTMVAIDAEFVQIRSAEVEIRTDGSQQVSKQATISLGRVSVLRAEGEMAGTALMDDYIATREHVEDYLTRYSGLRAGDLDPGQSQHHLLPLKAVYKKLAYMVSMGVIFIGHGLKSDFHTINILVPPSQVFDTVDLYWKPGHRRISLRFLISYLLRDDEFRDFQVDTHDSILDAKAALHLYLLYKKLKESDDPEAFNNKLDDIYRAGNVNNWDPMTDWAVFEEAKPLVPVTPAKDQARPDSARLIPISPNRSDSLQAADVDQGVAGEELFPVTPELEPNQH